MTERLRVAVLVSGSGSNLQALLNRFNGGDDSSAEVVRVIASKPGIRALDRAAAAGVPAVVLGRPSEDGEDDAAPSLLEELQDSGAGLVVLAGYMKLVPDDAVRAYAGRMINVHPALLPSFGGAGMYGQRVHAAVLRSGARVSGVTVHFVDEEYDRGPIVAQWPVPVFEDDTPEVLAARVLIVEHRLLPDVVSALARGDVSLDAEGRVSWTRPFFPSESFSADGADGTGAPGRHPHHMD